MTLPPTAQKTGLPPGTRPMQTPDSCAVLGVMLPAGTTFHVTSSGDQAMADGVVLVLPTRTAVVPYRAAPNQGALAPTVALLHTPVLSLPVSTTAVFSGSTPRLPLLAPAPVPAAPLGS